LPEQEKRDIRELFGQDKDREDTGKVTVSCFGDFRVFLSDQGDEIQWRTKKAQALFAYLFHLQGRPVDKDVLLLQLWPEADKKSATTLLHTTLYSIRKTLAAYRLEDLISYQNKRYAMKMELVHSDLEEMDQLCQALEHGDKVFVHGRGDFLKCYKGSYLGGVTGNFSESRKAYYEKKFLEICRLLAERTMKEGRFEDAVAYLDRAIAVDPYGEDLYLLVLQCLRALGEVKRAKRYYEQIVRVLKEDLDVEPAAEVTGAYRNCLEEGSLRKKGTAI
jgi:two-component SAPR family response regulator